MQVAVFELFAYRIDYLNVLGINTEYNDRFDEQNAIEMQNLVGGDKRNSLSNGPGMGNGQMRRPDSSEW